MRKIFTFLFTLIVMGIFTEDVNAQTIVGYKNVELGENINSLDNRKWPIRKDPSEPDNIKWYRYKDRLARQADNVKLKSITVKAEDDIINEIVLLFKPSDKSDMILYLDENYGKSENSVKWKVGPMEISLTDTRAIFKLN